MLSYCAIFLLILNCYVEEVITEEMLLQETLADDIYDQRAENSLYEEQYKEIKDVISAIAANISLPSSNNSQNTQELFDQIIQEYNLGQNNEDANLDIDGLLTKYNRTVETHEVVTEDGYILKMFRIPGNGTPCLLMHGILSSADDFVIAGPESALGYLLSNKGFDVWFGNARGNKYSRRHEYFNTSGSAFWNFSWHEIGIYDLPAMIDYILKKTGQSSIKYIGHSQGTTTFFVLTSERPEYNEKVSQMIALAPVAYLSNTKSIILRVLAGYHNIIYKIAKRLGIYEISLNNIVMNTIKEVMCETYGELTEIACLNAVFLITGFDMEQLNATNLPVIISHSSSGSSLKQLDHYAQEIISGKFAKYDYGVRKNKILYGMESPPEYNVKQIVTPVYLIYSEGDFLAQPADVDRIAAELGNLAEKYKIPYSNFNHIDFLYAKDVKTLVYDKVISILESQS